MTEPGTTVSKYSIGRFALSSLCSFLVHPIPLASLSQPVVLLACYYYSILFCSGTFFAARPLNSLPLFSPLSKTKKENRLF
ncbi:MAG: hypothetical protein BYD32DRAFT_415697 [Podila humilis]|nr:MAG: hypothetical protein BYD32DRAFT_415697 [Podila humilis]